MTNFLVGGVWFGQPAGLEVERVNGAGQAEPRRIVTLYGDGRGGKLDDGSEFTADDVRDGHIRKAAVGVLSCE